MLSHTIDICHCPEGIKRFSDKIIRYTHIFHIDILTWLRAESLFFYTVYVHYIKNQILMFLFNFINKNISFGNMELNYCVCDWIVSC